MISCTSAPIKVTLDGFSHSSALNLASEELTGFLEKASGTKNKFEVIFRFEKSYTQGEFSYTQTGKNKFILAGGEPIAVLHAVYSLLEEVGYTFDITGVTPPEKVNLFALDGIDKKIVPHVRWRGIRQHVNFPMDISSYPIDEAQEYLKNLVRLRFNKIVIHSYPNQWYEVRYRDTTEYAGHFFYGDMHTFYDNELIREKVRFNDSIFCIPAAEPFYFNEQKRSEIAVSWMKQLIEHAKKLGLRVQFSFEPRMSSVEKIIETSRQILDTYPGIDELELITEETGGWGPACKAEDVEKTLQTWFSPEIANDPVVTAPIRPTQSDLNQLYTQIGIIARSIQQLNQTPDIRGRISEIKLGIYCTMPAYAPSAYHLARKALPGTRITIMPSHGSTGTAKHIDAILKTGDDLNLTEIYSWIEFDGLMYIQQNSIQGISQLFHKLDSIQAGKQLYSVLFNHWRTAENRTSARFASVSTLYRDTSVAGFYKDYAGRLGIKDHELYTKIMTSINDVDVFATTALGNIGFCWVGAWKRGGSYQWMNINNIEKALQTYMASGEMLSNLMSETKNQAGKEYLSFLGNRVLCSVIYLKAFREAAEIRSIKAEGQKTLSAPDKEKAIEICNHALLVFNQYMETHARMLPDRGCEGTLVSVWNAPIKGLKVLRSNFGGVPVEEPPHSVKPVDAPPLPIFYDMK